MVLLLLNKFAMKVVRNHAVFLKEFNNNFPCLIVVSVIAVLGINGGLVILYFFCKIFKK